MTLCAARDIRFDQVRFGLSAFFCICPVPQPLHCSPIGMYRTRLSFVQSKYAQVLAATCLGD